MLLTVVPVAVFLGLGRTAVIKGNGHGDAALTIAASAWSELLYAAMLLTIEPRVNGVAKDPAEAQAG